MEGFVAIPAEEAHALEESGVLKASMFGYSYPGRYIPLKESHQAALHAAMQSSAAQDRSAAGMAVSYFVLKMTFNHEQMIEHITSETLTRDKQHQGWRWWGDLRMGVGLLECSTDVFDF